MDTQEIFAPAGGVGQACPAPAPSPGRYAILRHCRSTDTHYDLLLEVPGHELLATWQVFVPPERWGAAPVAATKLPDHRRMYLDYEGPISNDRGAVTRVDAGIQKLLELSPLRWRCVLRSSHCEGAEMALVLIRDNRAEPKCSNDDWTLTVQHA